MEQNSFQEVDVFDAIDFKRLFDIIRKNFLLLLLGLVLGAGGAFGFSQYQIPVYEAKTQVMVTRSSSSGPVTDVTQALNAQQLGQTYVELLSQDWVRDDVAARIGGEVEEDQIDVSVASNTLILNIVAEDYDPNRAVLVADTLVQVLISQNESIQSQRYTDAESGLNMQVQQIQMQIDDAQTQLDLAKTGALDDRVTQIQQKIETAQTSVENTHSEITRLENITTTRANDLLRTYQNQFEQTQLLLDTQLAAYQDLNTKLETDPLAKEDEAYATSLQSQMAELGVQINATREQFSQLETDIAWLTPLAEEGAIDQALLEKQNALMLQESLLASYQEIYTNLLVSGDVQTDNDQIIKLEEDLNLYQQLYLNLVNSLETVRLEKMQNMPNVIQVSPATPSEDPVRPRVLMNTALGGFVGLALAVSGIFLSEFLDTTIRTREDVERVLQQPILGYLPQLEREELEKDGPYVVHVPRSPASEAFRSLRTNLEFIGVDDPLKSILISSSNAAEGKTTVAVNLAAVVAQSGKRVILVDADLRRPRMHRELGVVNRLGLSDVFRDRVALEDVIQQYDDLGLYIITSGGIPPNPAELLGSEKMNQILTTLEEQYDLVIIDSTPTLVTDSQLIAARTDGVLLVLYPGHTHAEAASAAVEQYHRVGARLLGTVFNNIQAGQGYGGYSPYANNYHYYQYDQKQS